MLEQDDVQPPNPPSALAQQEHKKGFFSKLLLTLGLRHEHIDDFENLTHLHYETVDPALEEALNYEAKKKVDDEEKAKHKKELKNEFLNKLGNTYEKLREEEQREEKEKTQLLHRKEKPLTFTENTSDIYEDRTPGQFTKNIEKEIRKIDSKLLFFDEDEANESSQWTGKEELEEKKRKTDFVKETDFKETQNETSDFLAEID